MKKLIAFIGLGLALTSCSKNEEVILIDQIFRINTSCEEVVEIDMEKLFDTTCTTEIVLSNPDNDLLKDGFYTNPGTAGGRSWTAYAQVTNGEIKVYVRHNEMDHGFDLVTDINSVDYKGDGVLIIDFNYHGLNIDNHIFKYSTTFRN